MKQIQTLDEKQSTFFDHRDPAIVKWLGWITRHLGSFANPD
jgi:hypothetical protein